MLGKSMSVNSINELDDSLFCLLFARQQIKMALTISLIVGTILNLINQGHLISTPEKINLVNIVLTYCVPYCVATISSALSTLKHQKKLQLIEKNKQICENNFLDYIANNTQRIDSIQSNQNENTSENIMLFINQFEAIQALISLQSIANNKAELDRVKALIMKRELGKSLPVLKDLVNQFANENTEQLGVNKDKVAVLSEQRVQLIEALKML